MSDVVLRYRGHYFLTYVSPTGKIQYIPCPHVDYDNDCGCRWSSVSYVEATFDWNNAIGMGGKTGNYWIYGYERGKSWRTFGDWEFQ